MSKLPHRPRPRPQRRAELPCRALVARQPRALSRVLRGHQQLVNRPHIPVRDDGIGVGNSIGSISGGDGGGDGARDGLEHAVPDQRA